VINLDLVARDVGLVWDLLSDVPSPDAHGDQAELALVG
jgi:hypothetical protein